MSAIPESGEGGTAPTGALPSLQVVPLRRQVDPDIVDFFREKLALAERGELVGMMCVFELHDGTSAYRRILLPGCSPSKLIGELEVVKSKLVADEIARLDL